MRSLSLGIATIAVGTLAVIAQPASAADVKVTPFDWLGASSASSTAVELAELAPNQSKGVTFTSAAEAGCAITARVPTAIVAIPRDSDLILLSLINFNDQQLWLTVWMEEAPPTLKPSPPPQ